VICSPESLPFFWPTFFLLVGRTRTWCLLHRWHCSVCPYLLSCTLSSHSQNIWGTVHLSVLNLPFSPQPGFPHIIPQSLLQRHPLSDRVNLSWWDCQELIPFCWNLTGFQLTTYIKSSFLYHRAFGVTHSFFSSVGNFFRPLLHHCAVVHIEVLSRDKHMWTFRFSGRPTPSFCICLCFSHPSGFPHVFLLKKEFPFYSIPFPLWLWLCQVILLRIPFF